jgi:hypothetical protein
LRRLFSLLAFFATVVGVVAFAATPQKGYLGAGRSKPFVNDGGWLEFGMVGLTQSDGGAFGALDLDGGVIFGGVMGGVIGSSKQGTLSKEQIKRVMGEHKHEVADCYEAVLARFPDAGQVPQGKVRLIFRISSSGRVDQAQVVPITLNDESFAGCIIDRVAKWVFPKPDGDGPVTVNYPLVFRPSE